MSCSVGHRHGSDPALLWLWRCPVATAPIQPLAWEPPYAAGAAQEMAKRQKKKKKDMTRNFRHGSLLTNLTSVYKDAGLIPGLTQWVKDLALP